MNASLKVVVEEEEEVEAQALGAHILQLPIEVQLHTFSLEIWVIIRIIPTHTMAMDIEILAILMIWNVLLKLKQEQLILISLFSP